MCSCPGLSCSLFNLLLASQGPLSLPWPWLCHLGMQEAAARRQGMALRLRGSCLLSYSLGIRLLLCWTLQRWDLHKKNEEVITALCAHCPPQRGTWEAQRGGDTHLSLGEYIVVFQEQRGRGGCSKQKRNSKQREGAAEVLCIQGNTPGA